MRCISLLQPWATLWAKQIDKKFETRTWHCSHHGLLAIHAGKSLPRPIIEMCLEEPFRSALARAGIKMLSDLPRGAVIAVCDGIIVHRTDNILPGGQYHEWRGRRFMVSAHERQFGDFSRGRYFWEPVDMQLLLEPVPTKGMLGLWEMSADVEAQVRAQMAMALASKGDE